MTSAPSAARPDRAGASGRRGRGGGWPAAIAAAELPVLLLVIAPALLFPGTASLLAILLLAPVWACQARLTGRVIPPSPLNLALIALLAMVALSLVVSPDRANSLGKVSGVLLGMLLFWALVRWTVTPARLGLAIAAFAAAGAGLAVLGLVGIDWIDKFPAFAGIARRMPRIIRGLPGAPDGFQPNAVAGCLLLFVPVQAALLAARFRHQAPGFFTTRPWSWRSVQALVLTLTGGTLILTQSRGAWMGLAAAGAAALAWSGRTGRVVVAALAAAGLAVTLAIGPETVAELGIGRAGPGMAANLSGRMELWSRAIAAISDFPVTGMGMNTFRRAVPSMYPTFLTAPDVDISHAHNHLMQAALDLGLPGLIAYLALWLVIAFVVMDTYRRSTGVYRYLAGGLGAGLIAHFVFSLTDAIALGAKAGVSFWLTLAVAVSLHQVARPTPPAGGDGG